MPTPNDEQIARINEKLKTWRQGDVVLYGSIVLPHLADLREALAPASIDIARARATAGEALGWEVVSDDVLGCVVFNQTCDICRHFADQPYVRV